MRYSSAGYLQHEHELTGNCTIVVYLNEIRYCFVLIAETHRTALILNVLVDLLVHQISISTRPPAKMSTSGRSSGSKPPDQKKVPDTTQPSSIV